MRSPASPMSGASSSTSIAPRAPPSPGKAIRRIAELHAVEKAARGLPPKARARLRRADARPVLGELEAWLAAQLPALSAKTPLAAAIRHALIRLPRLRPCLEHGTLEAENDAAERAMRPIALGRRNHLFVGSQGGGHAAAAACTPIETAKLRGADPETWLGLYPRPHPGPQDHPPRPAHAPEPPLSAVRPGAYARPPAARGRSGPRDADPLVSATPAA